VRASFNSLVPASLSDATAECLVDAGIRRLAEHRELHDKVEFSVLPTCYTADLEKTFADRFTGLLDSAVIAESIEALRQLTRAIIEHADAWGRTEDAELSELKARRGACAGEPALDRVASLLADAADFGVTPFVGHARRAFIAIDILLSLVRVGALSQDGFRALLASTDTVTRRFQRARLEKSRAELLSAYGHLRPGTYDITSPRYDHAPDVYLASTQAMPSVEPPHFALDRSEASAIETYLAKAGIDRDPHDFIRYAIRAIAAREETKFEFTKNVSDALEVIASACEAQGLTRDDASFLSLDDFLASGLHRGALDEIVRTRRARYAADCQTRLPILLVSPEELWSFGYGDGQPNYIGAAVVGGPPLCWPTTQAFDGAILLIENADPGFDWIFTTRMAGFVTMFGGPNSHMAIRAHELGITAIIGSGPSLFARCRAARMLRIDPVVKKAEIVL
jgi:glutamine kinase